MLDRAGGPAAWGSVALAVALAVGGIIPLASGLSGHLSRSLTWWERGLLLAAAAAALFPARGDVPGGVSALNLAGIGLFLVVFAWTRLSLPKGDAAAG